MGNKLGSPFQCTTTSLRWTKSLVLRKGSALLLLFVGYQEPAAWPAIDQLAAVPVPAFGFGRVWTRLDSGGFQGFHLVILTHSLLSHSVRSLEGTEGCS